jgi:hypothetical protein
MELKSQMVQVDRAESVEELLSLKPQRVILKVQVLQKIAQKVTQGERRGQGAMRQKTLEDKGFQELVQSIKKEFIRGEEGMNDFKRNTVLYSLMQLRY